MKKLFNKIISLFRKKKIVYTPTMYLYYDKELLEEAQKIEIEKLIPPQIKVK